jgi:hypothetical protein
MSHSQDIRDAAQGLTSDLEITLLTSHDRPPSGVSRVGGPGVELGDRQPQDHEGRAMTHIWTLATADVPALAAAFPGAAAVALYVLDPQENEAWEADSGLTALVVLSADDVAGPAAEPTDEDLSPRDVTAESIAVASAAFEDHTDDSEDSARRTLRSKIYGASARAGGRPIWLQGDECDGSFLLQFDESFADLNLGDCGVMYVFAETQFWQCH